MRFIKRIILSGLILLLLSLSAIFVSDSLVKTCNADKIYTSTKEIPFNKVGLLLGTGKYLSSGQINAYYANRIAAAVALYQAEKIKYILVSGDNSTVNYDEPSTIKEDLIAQGFPADKIYLDYAGFRTLDSVIRSKAIFGQKNITVISQQFHNERALFIANHKAINALAFNAQDVNLRYGFKTQVREKLARVKMMLDLLFGKQAKFLGKQIEIG